jgi:hypothetical protein
MVAAYMMERTIAGYSSWRTLANVGELFVGCRDGLEACRTVS